MTLPTVPLFVEYLGGNEQLIGFVVGIFTFSALIVRPLAGHLLESRGRGLIFLLGLVIFIFSIGSYSFAASILFLFFMRIVQGIGWGFSTTASGTIVTDIIPPSRRGEGLGYFGLSGNIALAFGPTLGLFLVGIISFEYLFLICALLGLIAFILAFLIKYKKVDKKDETVSWRKMALFEKNALKPSILMFFITIPFGGGAAFLPIYTAEKEIDGIHIYFFIFAFALLLTRFFAGQLYDRKGHKVIFLPGTLLIFSAMLFLVWLPNSTILLTAAFCHGFGFGMVQPALQAWAMNRSPKNRRGIANATFFSFFDLGIGLGAVIFGQIGHWFNLQSIYLTSAVSVILAVLYYFYLLKKDHPPHSTS